MRISLVLPTWNAGPLLDEVLAAVARQPGAERLERVAIDSSSTDDTPSCLRRHGFTVHTIPQREFNHGATRDLAIERCSGDVIVLLTQDATPADAEWLPRLMECYVDPQVGAAYCRQIPRPECNPILAARLGDWTAGQDQPRVQRVADAAAFARLAPLERLATSAFDNVAGSVRRSAWQQHRFGLRRFGEDVAFGKRLVLSGWSIVYQPRSRVIHSHNRTPQAEGRRMYCDHANLRELFDVRLLPDYDAFVACVAWGREHYGRIADAQALPETDKAALRRWAEAYAFWAALGQWLGANSAEYLAGPLGPFFARVDRWMRRGV